VVGEPGEGTTIRPGTRTRVHIGVITGVTRDQLLQLTADRLERALR
jgi:hypothetical protein